MQDAVYANDKAIQCLTSRRLHYSGEHGSYVVSVWGVHPYSADVAFDDPTPPANLAMPERINPGHRSPAADPEIPEAD